MKQSPDNALRQLMRELAQSTEPAQSWEELEDSARLGRRASRTTRSRRTLVPALAITGSAAIVVGGAVLVTRDSDDDPFMAGSTNSEPAGSAAPEVAAPSSDGTGTPPESVAEGPRPDEAMWPRVATPDDLLGLSQHVIAVDIVESGEERKLVEFGAAENSVYEYWGRDADVISAPESGPIAIGDRITLVRLVHNVSVVDPETGETRQLAPAEGFAEPLNDDGYVVGVTRVEQLRDDGAWGVVAGQNGLVSLVRDSGPWIVDPTPEWSRLQQPASELERTLSGRRLDVVMELFERRR